jgi:precorrin-6A synthase
LRKVLVIGIGPGNADYITVQAIKALNTVDAFFVIDKGPDKEMLNRVRTQICDEHIRNRQFRIVTARDPERDRNPADYRTAVDEWHQKRTGIYERMIIDELGENECGAFLVWGDPSLYDSTIRILDDVSVRGRVPFDYEVIPGITAIQVLAARHRIPLNRIGESIHITTGRTLTEGGAPAPTNVVVMLDGGCSFKHVDHDGMDIYWGAYLGTEHEILVSGKLKEVAGEIESIKIEARKRIGWMMDTFLLRKT